MLWMPASLVKCTEPYSFLKRRKGRDVGLLGGLRGNVQEAAFILMKTLFGTPYYVPKCTLGHSDAKYVLFGHCFLSCTVVLN